MWCSIHDFVIMYTKESVSLSKKILVDLKKTSLQIILKNLHLCPYYKEIYFLRVSYLYIHFFDSFKRVWEIFWLFQNERVRFIHGNLFYVIRGLQFILNHNLYQLVIFVCNFYCLRKTILYPLIHTKAYVFVVYVCLILWKSLCIWPRKYCIQI